VWKRQFDHADGVNKSLLAISQPDVWGGEGSKVVANNNNGVKLQSLPEKKKPSEEATHLFVEFDPCEVTFGVCVLQAEEPDFTKTDGLDDLIEELLAGGALLDGEFQLGVHRRDTNI
jgi:hypothetical protein